MTLSSRIYKTALALAAALAIAFIWSAQAKACNSATECFEVANLQDIASEQSFNQGALYQEAARQEFVRGNAPAASLYSEGAKQKFNEAGFYALASQGNYEKGRFIRAASGFNAGIASSNHGAHAPGCMGEDVAKGRYGFGHIWIHNRCGVPWRNPMRVKVVITGGRDSGCMSIGRGNARDFAFWGLYHGLHLC